MQPNLLNEMQSVFATTTKIHGNNTFSYEEAFFTVRIEKMRLFDGFFTFNVLDDSIW